MQRNYSQLKAQKSLESPNDETDLSSPPDADFRMEAIKMLKELRKIIGRNTDYCNKELEATRGTNQIGQLHCQDRKQATSSEQKTK